MKTIRNKTRKPLRINLPGGKTLFLGGLREAQVRPAALDHPGVKKLLDAGEVEVVDTTTSKLTTGGGGGFANKGSRGYVSGRLKTQSGDR